MLAKASGWRVPWPAPSFFRSRPLMCTALALAMGITLARVVAYGWWIWLAAVAAAAGAFWLWRKRLPVLPLAMAAAVLLGMARGGAALHVPQMPPMETWTVQGTVDGAVSQSDKGFSFWLRNMQVWNAGQDAWEPVSSGLYCFYATDAASTRLAHGQRVQVKGRVYLPDVPRNPGGFDQRMWMAQHGAHVRMYTAEAPRIEAGAAFSLRGKALDLSGSLGERMDTVFAQASPVVRAVLLGDQSEVPASWNEWMRDAGIIHLLAVSGLHVGLWYLLLERLLRPLPLPPWARLILLAAVLCAYAFVTGLRPSVLRAVLMLLAVQGGHVAHRKPDTLTTLSLAAVVILLARPLELFAAGFQMSFGAVLGIVLLGPPLRRLVPGKVAWVRDSLSTSAAAQLGILPALSHRYATVSVVGLVLNLAAVPLAGVLVPLAALAVLLDAIWMPLGFLPVQAVRGMVAAIVLLSRIASRIPFATLPIGAFAWWTAAAFFAGMLLCSTAVIWRWPYRAAAMAVAVILAVGIGYAHGSFFIRYVQLDVGQALSGVLHTPGGTFVYDTGGENSDTTEYLQYTGSRVKGVFLSHPHTDHVGGLSEMLEAGIRIDTVYVPQNADAFGAEPRYDHRLEVARWYGAEVVELAAGDTLDLGGVRATVIAPEAEPERGSDPNDRSLVLLLEIGEWSVLLTGDADGAAEPMGVDTDVLQVAHHGSAQAARDGFLQDATPDIALVSVGRNSYGHPDAQTLRRLEDAGADIYITQETGAVTLYFTPRGIKVEAMLE